MSVRPGKILVVGLGPGPATHRTPEAERALAEAEELFGYGPYLDRAPLRDGQVRHPTDNREEAARAAAALERAAAGAVVAMVTGGDPGVFAMAAAVCEQIDHGPPAWREIEVEVIPGITAMLAAAARCGAPLGHDFCALSLSDNLKPWPLVERRLEAAARAGLVIALYNPRSTARPWQMGAALDRLRRVLPPQTPVVFARAACRADERIVIAPLCEADPEQVDMATCVIIGSPATRVVARPALPPLVYSPRFATAEDSAFLPPAPPPPPPSRDPAPARPRWPAPPHPRVVRFPPLNPHPWPVPPLSPDCLTRLPDAAALETLRQRAAERYGAPSPAHVVAAPGSQSLLPMLAGLVPPGEARILGPTYAEHARAAATAGHRVVEGARLEDLSGADLAVVVNPNNPDGGLRDRAALLDLAADQARRGGLLVVDQAFMEIAPPGHALDGDTDAPGLVVLRSFGKFHGLAGVRLGFALCAPVLAETLSRRLGPWAVSGPALEIGCAALADHAWAEATRARLIADGHHLDSLLRGAGLTVLGGTALFRLVSTPAAAGLAHHLGERGIMVRTFDTAPDRLRFGLPGATADWERLAEALDGYKQGV